MNKSVITRRGPPIAATRNGQPTGRSKRVVVLHSGGLDSTVCLLQARSRGHQVLSLGIDYGQRHSVELAYANAQALQFGVERKVIRVAWDKPEHELPLNREVGEMRQSVSSAFLPGRNGVFLMLACAEAAGIGASEVWTGVNSVDFSGYPDCTPDFITSFRRMLRVGMPGGPRIVAPLQSLTKIAIARRAAKLGLKPGDTWSCYRPRIVPMGIVPCEQCDACVLHAHAWANVLTSKHAKELAAGPQ